MDDLILLIEDDAEFGETVKDYFTSNGLSVIWAKDGASGIDFFKNAIPRLVLLDVQLPDMDGFEVAGLFQKINNTIPVIFMTGTALADEDFANAYLNLYAKNYLEKPIKLPVALAQVKSLLYPPSVKIYNSAHVRIKIEAQHLFINDREFSLRDKEIQVFSLLLDHINQTVDRNEILFRIWKHDDFCLKDSLNGCISSIKKVLKNFPDIKLQTIYGKGYALRVK